MKVVALGASAIEVVADVVADLTIAHGLHRPSGHDERDRRCRAVNRNVDVHVQAEADQVVCSPDRSGSARIVKSR